MNNRFKRKNIPRPLQLKVWNKDYWMCRYCGDPVFFAPTLKELGRLNPGHGYYDAHGCHNKMFDYFARHWSSVDHIKPFSRNGSHNEENFVTACMYCNEKFGNRSEAYKRKLLKKKSDTYVKLANWDGLSKLYLVLMGQKQDSWTKLM